MKIMNLIVMTVLVVGCSTFSKKQCQNFNWKTEGYQMAIEGLTEVETLELFRNKCELKHEVSADKEALKKGFAEGIQVFCRPSLARRFGSKGGYYRGSCPKELEDSFYKEYAKGVNSYLYSQVTLLQSEVSSMRATLSSLRSENRALRNELFNVRARRQQ